MTFVFISHFAYYRAGSRVLLAFSLFSTFLFASSEEVSAGSVHLKSITIKASPALLENSITRSAIEDALILLRKGFPDASVSLNNRAAQVTIILTEPSKPGMKQMSSSRPYGYLYYPKHNYEWRSTARNGAVRLTLITPSFEGTAFGIYGLLQERLGFKFYHPRRTIIPTHKIWPLASHFRWNANPRFDKKGFHIHTLHPIELAEQLNNPSINGSLSDAKEYIDWLARNQQNLFQFYLLRDVDRQQWTSHAKEITKYAHNRGILIGVEVSLSCLQQKTFQLIRLLSPMKSFKIQIDENLAWLLQTGWDFVTVDFAMGEYMPDLGEEMPKWRDYVIEQISDKYKTKVLYATHVIPPKECVKMPGIFSSRCDIGKPISPNAGVLIHSVMCYSITEEKAPVYGNENMRFVFKRAAQETKLRETWYWPESAYWVTFDNSVPLLLLPYLDARWADINTMKMIGVDNHLTFSSGWEWGYWLIDWSIARWSWLYTENGRIKASHPLSSIYDLFPDTRIRNAYRKALALQNYYFKERGLMPLMSSIDPSAEMPAPFNNPFQPRPDFTLKWLRNDASQAECENILKGPVALLDQYAYKMDRLAGSLNKQSKRFFPTRGHDMPELRLIADELTKSLKISALRAKHRSLTLRAIIAMNNHAKIDSKNFDTESLLRQAAAVRREALELVHMQETVYRYPVQLIARKRSSLTAYEFGYLYPASNLFFWWREEEQARNNRFDALYLPLWDYRRIIGLESLF